MIDTTAIENIHKRFNLGNPPPEGHEYVGKFCKHLWEEALFEKVNKLGVHDRWLELHRLWRGEKSRGRAYPTVGVNYLFKTIDAYCAILTEKEPKAEVYSDDSNDEQTKALDMDVQSWWHETEQQASVYLSIQNFMVYGTTIEKAIFSSKDDDGKIVLRDPFNFFPAPGFKMLDMDNIPYVCDAFFLPTWEIRKTFGVPDHVHIPADADSQLFGGEREEIRGGKLSSVGPNRHYSSGYATISGSTDKRYLKDQALVVEVWIRDHSTTEEPIFEEVEAPIINEYSGLPVLDERGRPVLGQAEKKQVGTRTRPNYPDGIRKITICPALMSSRVGCVLDDSPNPSINWELIGQRVAFLVETGLQQPMFDEMTGQPVVDPLTGQQVIQHVAVSQEQAEQIALEIASRSYLWGRFPFSVVGSKLDTTQWWAFSVIEQLEPLQGKAEALLTKILMFYNRYMFPFLVIPENCGVMDEEIDNAPGKILRPNWATAQARAIYYVEPPPVPPGLLDLLQYLLMTMDILSGTPEVTEGRRPKGVSAASAIIALQDKASTIFQPQVRAIDKLIRNRGRMRISLIQNWGTRERPVKVNDAVVNMVGINLSGSFKYKVESGSTAPITKAGRRQQYLQLFQMQAMTIDALLEELEIPHRERIIEQLAEQNSLPGAIKILIDAGLPEEQAMELYRYLIQPQKVPVRQLQGNNEPETNLETKRFTAPPHGSSESMQAAYDQMQGGPE